MKTEYPFISSKAGAWILLGWVFLDLRLVDYACEFKGSYALASVFLSAAVIFWLKNRKKVFIQLLPGKETIRQVVIPVFLSFLLIPLGFATGFISLNFSLPKLLLSPLIFAGIYLTVGLVEELVFRQIILVYLEQRFNFAAALIGSSMLFGLFHLNNGEFPNWLYCFLAAAAGVIYGLAFKKSGLAGAVIVHTFVDTFWLVFFKPLYL